MPKKQEDQKKKIISVTMSQPLVGKIDKLVDERVGRSRAQLIEDAVRWFLDFTVHEWTERGIYLNNVRILLQSETVSSLFFSKLTPGDQYELGKTAGSQAPVSDVLKIEYGVDPTDKENRELIFELLESYGWGSFRDQGEMIVIGSPFYPAPFLRGYFETLLDLDLQLVETNVKDNVALKIV
jgi:Arc/MetJ-type ribon-helix-helix transcriptional regulator